LDQNKYASIDSVGFLIGRHTFKMAAMMMPASPLSACDIIGSLTVDISFAVCRRHQWRTGHSSLVAHFV